MTMKAPVVAVLLAAGLAACGPRVPESNPQGAGFQDYNSYMKSRANSPYAPAAPQAMTGFSPDAAAAAIDAASGVAPAPGTASGAPLDATGQTGMQAGMQTGTQTGALIGSQAGAPTATGAALPPIASNACAGRGNAFAGIQETTSEMNYASGKVSDEQDFSAVTSRETIASDKQRIECNREQYIVVQPGALPVRPGDSGPNIAQYALQTNNPPGVKLYSRPPFYLTSPEKACAKFASPDLAQQAFLAAGGPQRDPKALDPDGDGFACAWDPRPFRNAKQ